MKLKQEGRAAFSQFDVQLSQLSRKDSFSVDSMEEQSKKRGSE